MKQLRNSVAALTLGVISAASPAAAQQNMYTFEITPFAAYRIGGQFDDEDVGGKFELNESSAHGIMLNGHVRTDGQWEFLYARQNTEVDTQGLFASSPLVDLDVDYYQLGGTYLFNERSVRPFIAMTLGVTRFDPQPAEFSAESFFSASFGAGIQVNATKRIGLRLEGRVFATFLDDDSTIFCSSIDGFGACLIQVEGTLLTQWEARAGLVFRF